jgi:ribosomal protein S18 acetylase RimI-like enzyme
VAAGYVLRPAEPDDRTAIEVVVEQAYTAYTERIGRRPAPMSADYAALIAEGAVTVAVADGIVVGVLVAQPSQDTLLLENVAVCPSAQGRGIGLALIAHAETMAGSQGFPAVTLYTNARMTENVVLYRSLGYVETDRRREDGFDRVFFRKAV